MDLAKELKNAASKLKAPDEIEEFLLDVIREQTLKSNDSPLR